MFSKLLRIISIVFFVAFWEIIIVHTPTSDIFFSWYMMGCALFTFQIVRLDNVLSTESKLASILIASPLWFVFMPFYVIKKA